MVAHIRHVLGRAMSFGQRYVLGREPGAHGSSALTIIGERPQSPAAFVSDRPDWVQADPRWIARAYASASERPTGGWCVIDASERIDDRPRSFTIMGREVVAFRDKTQGGQLYVATGACPHMGAALCDGHTEGNLIVCPWHGLKLSPEGHGSFRHLPAYDDGLLSWVRIDGMEGEALARPVIAARPSRGLSAVVRQEAKCDPEDVIRNRLDPWHGAHYHPHTFASLKVVDRQVDAIVVRVAYRVFGPIAVEVDARFHCPDARTIVMTIVEGEGRGSVVETHATPIEAGRTAIVELTLADSDRSGFAFARALASWVRPYMERNAARLWVEDVRYAERLFSQRNRARRSTAVESSRRLSVVKGDRLSDRR